MSSCRRSTDECRFRVMGKCYHGKERKQQQYLKYLHIGQLAVTSLDIAKVFAFYFKILNHLEIASSTGPLRFSVKQLRSSEEIFVNLLMALGC